MSKGFTIPRTFEAAEKRLSDIDGLVTASEWERAAIVATFVHVRPNGRGDIPKGMRSVQEFAASRIAGLRSEATIKKYRDAWLNHSGFEKPEPGMVVPLDELPEWESIVTELPQYKSKKDDIRQNVKAVAEMLEDDSFVSELSKHATNKGKAKVRDAVMPPVAPIVDDFRGGSNAGDVISSAIATDAIDKARKAIADVHRLNKAGDLPWTLIDKGYWEQIVNMVAAVTMTIDLSDVHSLIDSEGK